MRCFFFQAEDGIRDRLVTGVQTCALPIWRELFAVADRKQHLYQVGSMGCAAGMGLGVALNGARPVVVIDGDGSAPMTMGSSATKIGRASGTGRA